jgi:tight adherence protein B
VTGAWLFGLIGLAMGPVAATGFVRWRIARRRKAFEAALPDALTLIASSLSAGHTFLRAIQMMCEEAEPPISEEFARLVSETRLGDPVVDALGRMAKRLEIRDLDWVVQAIRIQQTVGGRLADLLHTLADFIRAREEVRRDVAVLTAEGRISAWVLTALAPVMLFAIQTVSPDYMQPMYHGLGLVVLVGTGVFMAIGSVIIFRMCKIEV